MSKEKNTSLSASIKELPLNPARTPVIVVAWLATLLASTLPDAIWQQFSGTIPNWLIWGKAGLILALILVTWAWKWLKLLRIYLILLWVHIMAWEILFYIQATPAWSQWTKSNTWVSGILMIQLIKFGIALLTLAALFILMGRRQRFFWVKGQVNAVAEPVRWLGIKDQISWKVLGSIVACAAALIMTIVLGLTNQPSTTILVKALPLFPAALLFAATNAFNEEVSFRSGLLAPLYEAIGKSHSLALTAIFFGLAHYSGGVPLATLPTILMVALLGWLMGKSMLETRGIYWAWLIHLVNDIPVFAFLAMGSV